MLSKIIYLFILRLGNAAGNLLVEFGFYQEVSSILYLHDLSQVCSCHEDYGRELVNQDLAPPSHPWPAAVAPRFLVSFMTAIVLVPAPPSSSLNV